MKRKLNNILKKYNKQRKELAEERQQKEES